MNKTEITVKALTGAMIIFMVVAMFSLYTYEIQTTAYNDGYTEGRINGWADGWREGVQFGVWVGYDEGLRYGYYMGLRDGYIYGYIDCYYGIYGVFPY